MDLYNMRKEITNGKTIYDLPLKVTYYARVSSEKDEQLNSLDVTEEELKPYEHDYCNTVSRIFKLIKITNIDLKI